MHSGQFVKAFLGTLVAMVVINPLLARFLPAPSTAA